MTAALTVDLCGRLADGIGPTVTIEIAQRASIADVRLALIAAFPSLAVAFAAMPVRAAIEEMLVDDAAMVAPGQRVALFPPVSGG
jgi:sulfur-carrier protein